ncbi:Osmolarity sensor protein EnvZ [Pseudovibrio sp. W64]|uniref:ATP-binding protein n=1 Tax=unclassified Pseudovibrio TaxID=2627060 RepID=UPI0007AE5299|nr:MULTISPECIES: ATP-binding protein [unclassified Pseudovibrio]KZK76915.1 Osmolarity sensor protein EnvZ [Pseudovibrio sp. W64]KZK84119.1 Osmolarity sensor protein EnvZ [Pseudovibrio sp. Ad13]
MKFLRYLIPRRLAPQLILLLLAALIFSQVVSFVLLGRERQVALANLARDNALWRTANVVKLLEATPPRLQKQVLRTVSNTRTRFSIGDTPVVAETGGDESMEARLADYLKRKLDHDRQARVAVIYNERFQEEKWRERSSPPPEGRERSSHGSMQAMHDRRDDYFKKYRWFSLKGVQLFAAIELKNGQWLNIESNFRLPKPSFVPILLPIVIMALLTILIIWVSVYRLTKPLRTLEAAANDLGRGADVKPLKEAGPAEVQAVTRSFNQMQERLTRFISDRTRMLAAISHDLRTPITSLRIRAEFIDDDEDRERMIATLDEMQAMVEETLAFTREDSKQEELRSVDLGGLLESIANDQEDMGNHVSVEAHNRVVLKCRPMSLKRAFQNLIGNAIRYGEQAEVSFRVDEAHAEVRIADKGPGIPQNRLEDVFEPFVRLEESRNEETGGIGLGLAITRSIIHAQGGTIRLENGEENGLVAIVRLPL